MFANVATRTESDTRSGRRRVVNFTASVQEADSPLQRLKVSDLSTTGCRLQVASDLAKDTEVWIKFAGLLPVRARVMWEQGDEAGCEFVEPLCESDISSLLPPPGTITRKKLFSNPIQDSNAAFSAGSQGSYSELRR
jgi:hypothetical protein